MNPRATVFGDVRMSAIGVYRAVTEGSVYTVAFHEQQGRRFVVVRGETPGNLPVLLRDSEPRSGGRSLFDTPPHDWVGHPLEIAMMVSSIVLSVIPETEERALADVGRGVADAAPSLAERSPWSRPVPNVAPVVLTPPGGVATSASPPAPGGLSDSPRIVSLAARGTLPAEDAEVAAASRAFDRMVRATPAKPIPQLQASPAPKAAPPGPAEAPLSYPQRHVHYAESIVQLLRSIARRDRVFEDLAQTPLRTRMRAALDECATLLETIRRRDR